jgi:hypothetical protein
MCIWSAARGRLRCSPAPGRVPTAANLWERSSMLLRWQIGGQFDLKAANDEKIQTNGANGVSRGRMRNHHRRLCRNRTRASGRFYSPGERHSSSCARRGAAAQHAINAAISNFQSIESKYCASIERNTRLPGNAGYKSRRALSGAPGRPALARRCPILRLALLSALEDGRFGDAGHEAP